VDVTSIVHGSIFIIHYVSDRRPGNEANEKLGRGPGNEANFARLIVDTRSLVVPETLEDEQYVVIHRLISLPY